MPKGLSVPNGRLDGEGVAQLPKPYLEGSARLQLGVLPARRELAEGGLGMGNGAGGLGGSRDPTEWGCCGQGRMGRVNKKLSDNALTIG